MSAALPAWDRLRADGHGRLRVEAPRAVDIEVVEIVDGDLPDLDGATVFDAWREGDVYRLRAARVTDGAAATWGVTARRLHLVRPDPALLRLLGIDPGQPPLDVELIGAAPIPVTEPGLVCSCRAVGDDAVVRAIAAGWWTADALKRATRLAFGECQGRRCLPLAAARLEMAVDDPRAQVTPRPPLVPVPASVLAAFAGS